MLRSISLTVALVLFALTTVLGEPLDTDAANSSVSKRALVHQATRAEVIARAQRRRTSTGRERRQQPSGVAGTRPFCGQVQLGQRFVLQLTQTPSLSQQNKYVVASNTDYAVTAVTQSEGTVFSFTSLCRLVIDGTNDVAGVPANGDDGSITPIDQTASNPGSMSLSCGTPSAPATMTLACTTSRSPESRTLATTFTARLVYTSNTAAFTPGVFSVILV